MTRGLTILVAAALLSASCGNDNPTSPTTTTASTTTTTTTPTTSSSSALVFEGTLDPKGAKFYSFTTTTTGLATVGLTSLAIVGHHDALDVPVRIGVGVPKGEGCALSQSIDTSPSLISQLTAPIIVTGIYCIGIVDIDWLASPISAP